MKQTKRSATVSDVAREAGVAMGTVSKVINGLPVGESYRLKVEAAIKKLNYQVNPSAKALKNNRTYTIALIIPNTITPFFALLTHHVNMALEKQGYKMMLCFTQYDATMPNVEVAFKPQSLTNVMGEYLAKNGKTQLRIAETEKYAHVTFFFNGGVEAAFEGEDRALINSPKVATYDLQPEMSAYEVADECVARIESDKYDVIILNFANCDMVGHTGVFDAAVKAVEAVDACAGKVIDAVLAKGGAVLLTADHGNADQMYDPDPEHPFTAHTTNPVPFLVAGLGDVSLRKGGVLADIAPTMLKILELPQPEEMTGKSIIE